MYTYNYHKLDSFISRVLQSSVSPEAWEWLNMQADKFNSAQKIQALFTAFTAAPRFVGKSVLTPGEHPDSISEIAEGFTLSGYTADRLARVWLLLKWPSENKSEYVDNIAQLFKAAEMNELVALYGALPLLAYPEEWAEQCKEGIRSNIGIVLEAIICNNPYPAKYLNDQAWNQLVMKAFFTEKPVHQIIGLDKRANAMLAHTLSDYVHERWAAHRTTDPQIWRLIGPFINEYFFPDVKRILFEGSEKEKEAAALALQQSSYKPAKDLLNTQPSLKKAIENNELNWSTVAEPVTL